MIRRSLPLLAFTVFASQAYANPLVDTVTQQLIDQGYERIEISRTFLGRVRIEATGNGSEREVIVNPRTGQVLRDYWEDEEDEEDRRAIEVGSDEDDEDDGPEDDWPDDEDHDDEDHDDDDDDGDDHDDDDDDDGDDEDDDGDDDDGGDDDDDDE